MANTQVENPYTGDWFSSDYFLVTIKKYPVAEHSVAYIEEHYDDPDNPMEFDESRTVQLPSEWTDEFNNEGVYGLFTLMPYPMAQKLVPEFDPSNIYSQFKFFSSNPYPMVQEPITGIDYNNITSVFQINQQYPFVFSEPEPIDYENIYTPFTVFDSRFHYYPALKLPLWDEDIVPPNWTYIPPTTISGNVDIISVAADDEEEPIILTSETYSPPVLDRDVYWDAYQTEANIYWSIYERQLNGGE